MASATGEAAAAAYSCELVRNESDWRDLRPEWEALWGLQARPCPFLSWDWASTWWDHFGRGGRLHIIVARDAGGALVGIAPLHLVRRRAFGVPVRALEFIGYRGSAVCADHLDFLAHPAERAPIVAALARTLAASPGWDVIRLADLSEDSPVPQIWRERVPCTRGVEEAGETCCYVPLPASSDALWETMRARHRSYFKTYLRDRRRLEEGHSAQFDASPVLPENLPPLMEELTRLHGLARQRRGEGGNFRLPAYRAFHEAVAARLAARGQLYLARLKCEGNLVAMLYGFHAGRVLYYYQGGFDTAWNTRGVGKLLLGWVLEDAIGRLGAEELDFLRGDEAYKALWTSQQRRTRHFIAWANGMRGAAARWEWALRARLRRRS